MPRKLSELGAAGMGASMDLSGGNEPLQTPTQSGPQAPESSPAPSPEVVDDEVGLEKAGDAMEDYSLSPREVWEMEIKAQGVTPKEAAAILDSIMSTGKYEETYRVGGTQFKFRTRTTVDADRTIEILQDLKPEATGVYSHVISRINLAASLAAFGNKAFSHSDPHDDNREKLDQEWRSRYRFCSTLPAPTFYLLTQVLQKFETKVALASDPRSLENF
jgi:hypothetical protein